MKKICAIIIPITSTIWIVHILGDYTEFEGNELLYVYQKIHFSEVITVSIIFLFLLNVSVRIIGIWIPDFSNEYLNLLLLSFLFQGACYFFSFFFHKAKNSIFLLIIYVVIASIASMEGSKVFNIIFLETKNIKEQIGLMLVQFMIAITFWISGFIWDLFFPKYN